MDFYQQLRNQIRETAQSGRLPTRTAEYLLLGPDLFYLLTRLSLDKEVPGLEKAKVVAALAYFVAPFDLLPEALLGASALIDDVAISLYVIHGLLNGSPAEVVQKYWQGEEDLLLLSKRLVRSAESLVGSKLLWERIRKALPR